MTDTLYTLIAGIGVVSAMVYLIINIALQIRAKKRLEMILIRHKQIIENQFNKQRKDLKNTDLDSEYEIALMLLRKEIDSLKEPTDKKVMRKTLDRKNFNNQKRYAFEIFSETGLTDVFGFK